MGPDPEKLEAIARFPSPEAATTRKSRVKAIQSFLGMCSYYRRHIEKFSVIARPLTELLKDESDGEWTVTQQESINKLKQALTTAPVLAYPRHQLPMYIYPDACDYGIGGALSQTIEGVERPIAYASRLLGKSERNYSITEKECLALVWCLKKFRSLVWGCQIVIVTDHQALCWLMEKRDLAGRLARWSLSLQEFDLTINYRSGKLHANADCLSRYPIKKPTGDDDEEERCLAVNRITIDEGIQGRLYREQREDSAWDWIIRKMEEGKKPRRLFYTIRNTEEDNREKPKDFDTSMFTPVNAERNPESIPRPPDSRTPGNRENDLENSATLLLASNEQTRRNLRSYLRKMSSTKGHKRQTRGNAAMYHHEQAV